MDKKIYSVAEMGRVLGIGINRAYEIAHSVNGPPTITIGRTLKIPVDGFNEWLARESKQKTRVV